MIDKFPGAHDLLHHLEPAYGEISITQMRAIGTSRYNNNNITNNNNYNNNNNSAMTRRERTPLINENVAAPEPIVQAQPPPAPSTTMTNVVGGLHEFTHPIKAHQQFSVRKSTKFHGLDRGSKVSTYRMNTKNRGVLFLVNIVHFEFHSSKQRKGADVDRDNLIALFREMGFKIFYYEDLTKDVCLTKRCANRCEFNEFSFLYCESGIYQTS